MHTTVNLKTDYSYKKGCILLSIFLSLLHIARKEHLKGWANDLHLQKDIKLYEKTIINLFVANYPLRGIAFFLRNRLKSSIPSYSPNWTNI